MYKIFDTYTRLDVYWNKRYIIFYSMSISKLSVELLHLVLNEFLFSTFTIAYEWSLENNRCVCCFLSK